MEHDRVDPYVGPSAFRREDAWRFFGRGRESEKLLAMIGSTRVTLVYGSSGAGKTSLLNARIIPALEKKRRHVFPIVRVGSEISHELEPSNVYVFNTVSYLAASDRGLSSSANLLETSLDQFLVESRKDASETGQRSILVFDQFEEIFTTHSRRRADREGFFQQIQQALNRDSLLSIVFVMREDHLAEIDRYAPLVPGHLRTRFRIERLKHEAALEAIRHPALKAGRPFDEGVAKTLVDDLRQERSEGGQEIVRGEYVEPVQLQVVCLQLWENLKAHPGKRITEKDLRTSGDVDQALESFYEEIIRRVALKSRLPQAPIRRFFAKTLITSGGIRSQVSRGRDHTEELPNKVIDLLLTEHLIRREKIRGGTWYELIHDRFIDPIQASNRKRSGKLRRRRLAIAMTVLALLTVLGLAWNRHRAREVRMTEAAQISQRARDILREHPPRSLWLVLKAAKAAGMVTRHLPPPIHDTLRQALQASRAKLVKSLPIGDVDHQLTLDGRGQSLGVLDQDGKISVWDVESGRQLLTLSDDGHVATALVLSYDGDALAAAFDNGSVQLWDVESRRLIHGFETGVEVFELLFSPSGDRIAATSFEGTVEIWDTRTARNTHSLSDLEGPIMACAFGPEGRLVATARATGTVVITDLESSFRVHTFPAGDDNALTFSPDGSSLASIGSGGVDVWDVATGMLPGLWQAEESLIYSVTFSRDNQYVTSALSDGTVRIWNLEANLRRVALAGNQELNLRPTLSQDGGRLAIAREPGKTEIWELIFSEVPSILSGHRARINGIAVSQQGKLAASGSDDRTARIWGLESGQLLKTLEGHEAPVTGVALSPNNERLATVSADHTARIWDLESGRVEQILIGHSGTVNAVTWSPGGTSIATASSDGTARTWDAESGSLLRELTHPGENVLAVAFSPDGKLLATAGGIAATHGGMVRLWPTRSTDKPIAFIAHSDLVNAVAFSPSGELLATGSDDKTAKVWDTHTATLQRMFTGHPGAVTAVAFAPDSSRLATSDVNGIVNFWHLISGAKDFTIPGPSPIWSLAFTPAGEHLLTGSSDARIRLEPLTAEDLMRLAEQRTGAEPMLQLEN